MWNVNKVLECAKVKYAENETEERNEEAIFEISGFRQLMGKFQEESWETDMGLQLVRTMTTGFPSFEGKQKSNTATHTMSLCRWEENIEEEQQCGNKRNEPPVRHWRLSDVRIFSQKGSVETYRRVDLWGGWDQHSTGSLLVNVPCKWALVCI